MSQEIPTPGRTHLEPLSMLWQALIAPQTLLVLMGLLSLALVAGILIPQIPSQATGDPQGWLAVQPGPVGQRTGLIQTLGLFDLYEAFWFRLLLALTGLVLFVWTVESADLAWRTTVRKRWTPDAFAFWERRASQVGLSSSLSLEETLARLREFLTGEGFRWVDVPVPPAPNLVAGRREIYLWARPLTYGALLLALVGLVVVGNWGWHSEDWQPVPGETQVVGHGSPRTVRLDAFHPQLGNDGRLHDSYSEVTWLEGSTAIGRDVVSIAHPATRQGVTLRQIGHVPIVRIRAWDIDGHPLMLQATGEELGLASEAEITFPSDAQSNLYIPSQDRFLALAFESQCAGGKPSLHLALLHDGGIEQQSSRVLSGSGSATFEGLRVNVNLTYGPILRMDYRPAMGLVVGSMALAVIALVAGWVASPRLTWIAVEPVGEDSGLIQILALPGTRGNLWLPGLVSRLRKVLAADA